MIFVCREENDLYHVLQASGHAYPRRESLDAAIEEARPGEGILALADAYPRPSSAVTAAQLAAARAKKLRLFLEYPASLPDCPLGAPQPTQWERAVVASNFFAPALRPGAILALHGCWFLPAPSVDAHLAAARVAGYRDAVYGLPEDAAPILFPFGGEGVLVAATGLSRFVTGRYGPGSAWKAIWERILHWANPAEEAISLSWTPAVRTQAGPDESLPETGEADAFARSARWFREQVVFSIDQKKGAIEGFEAAIDHNGRQMRRTWTRGDCTGETALVFACEWAQNGNPASRKLAGQLLDYVWSVPDFFQNDPKNPAYGLVNWYERGPAFYGDDNARVILPTLAAGRLLDDPRWDEPVLRCLLANLRTTGRLGFRRNRIDLAQLQDAETGWRFFQNEDTVSLAPHYQAYPWAAYLWTYALTGCESFLTGTKNAIRMTMEAYPRWHWTNGFTQELARMLLPLAYLVRIEDTPEHRGWLSRIAEDLLAQMQPCGAIRERMGDPECGSYPPPRSNAEYGTREASLIQENGDPACDLLYTANYAFLGLHEAAAATGDARLREAEDRLAEFLCRIQVRSKAQPYLDGAWMRSFDYELWEYWGSSADLGWGAWSVESGWTNAWIAAVLALRQRGETLFDLTTAPRLRKIAPKLAAEMLGAPTWK